jgi:hypothetical protein
MLLSVQTSDPTTSKSQTTSSAISECPETQTVLSQGQAWAHRIEIRVLCASGTSGERWKNIHSISGGNLPEPKVDVGVVLSDLDVQENLFACSILSINTHVRGKPWFIHHSRKTLVHPYW